MSPFARLVIFGLVVVLSLFGLTVITGSMSTDAGDKGGQSIRCQKKLVCDIAEIFDEDKTTYMTMFHGKLLEGHDIDYRVLTVSSEEDINAQAHEEFSNMKVGSRSHSGRGLLLVINVAKDEVRLEVSGGLEGIYTDAFVSYIQHRQMVPFFRAGRIADGVVATTEMMVTRAQDAAANKEFVPPSESVSYGGGVANPAMIGKGPDKNETPKNSMAGRRQGLEGMSPEDIFEIYLYVLESHDKDPMLPIYTKETQEWKKSWVVTAGQMDNEARDIKRCGAKETRTRGNYAVIRYDPEENRHCNPYFFEREDGVWRMDFLTMMHTIQFNNRNEWHLILSQQHPYGFAFTDWSFDRNGFPHK